MTAEEAIAELRGKIDRIGPVNMMAIDQFHRARNAALVSHHAAAGSHRLDCRDQSSDQPHRRDHSRAVPRGLYGHQRRTSSRPSRRCSAAARAGILAAGRSRSARKRHRHRRLATGQAPAERDAAVRRRESADRDCADVPAIFRYKPSPFCLLDEIDAPLDDANIGRFVEMLRVDDGPDAVHHHHAQPQDHGDCQPPVRGHHGGIGGFEAYLDTAQLVFKSSRVQGFGTLNF